VIMRDVVLSSEPRVLRPPPPQPSRPQAQPAPQGQPAPHAHPASQAQPGPHTQPAAHAQPAPQAPPPPPKPTLTLDAVDTWLTTQSAETRAAVAQGLATEIGALREQARAQGVELGRAQALQDVTKRTESSLAALSKITTATEEAFALEAGQLSEACADIVAAAFLKIAGEHLPGRDAIVGAVVEVLKRVKDTRQVTIKVSQQDLPLLRECEPHLQQVLGSRQVTLIADPRVSVGGCLVESSLGTLDGRVEVQIRELFETLRVAKATRWANA